MKAFTPLLLSLATLLLAGSCSSHLGPDLSDPKSQNVIDPAMHNSREDYRNLLNPDAPLSKDTVEGATTPDEYRTSVSAKSDEPPIPEIAPILAAPAPPKLGETKIVSLAVTDDVPLKDVLLELARLADIDIEVDAGISGGISFRAKERPFNEVIERIADLAGLRYSMKNNVLRVERDTPYVETYTLDFLNTERNTTNAINISTSVLSTGVAGSDSGGASGSGSSTSGSSSSGSSGSGGGGLTTGSQTAITSKTDSDFWQRFEGGVKQILAYVPERRVSENTPLPAQGAPQPTPPPTPGAAPNSPGSPAPSPSTPSGQPAEASGSTGSATADPTNYTINRQAGVLTVSATERQHTMIKEFLRRLEANSSAQVLIEAKIVEITLTDQFSSGVDWTSLFGRSEAFRVDTDFNGGIASSTGGDLTTFRLIRNNLTGANIDLDLAVRLAEQFGTTRTLSSPRLHAINNQQAVLTFARNEVYFKITIEREQQSSSTVTTQTTYSINSSVNTVPIGIILTMLPSINLNTNEVTLNVRPTLSRVVDRVEDPQLALAAALDPGFSSIPVRNLIPVVEVRELDSILKLRSGEVMVIGGLMEDRGINSDEGLPYAQDVPIVGNLFKGIERDNQTKELVIFIKATIMDSRGAIHDADKAVYKKYTRDPRPLPF